MKRLSIQILTENIPSNIISPYANFFSATEERKNPFTDNSVLKNNYSNTLLSLYEVYKCPCSQYIGFFQEKKFLDLNFGKEVSTFTTIADYFLQQSFINEESYLEDFNLFLPTQEHIKEINPYSKKQVEDCKIYFKKAFSYLEKEHPHLKRHLTEHLESNYQYPFGLFIMKKETFKSYGDFLFPLLFFLEKEINFKHLNIYESEILTFIAQKFSDIYFRYLKASLVPSECKETLTTLIKYDHLPSLPSPAFKENNIAICFTATDNYMPYASVMLQSIIEHSNPSQNYDVVILTDHLNENTPEIRKETNKLLQKQVSKISNFSVRFLNVTPFFEDIRIKNQHARLSIATFYRLKIPSLFTSYSKVLFLDTDMLVLDDLSLVYNIDMKDYHLAAVQDLVLAAMLNKNRPFWTNIPSWGNQKTKTSLDYFLDYIGIKYPEKLFQAGFLLLNLDKIREEGLEQKLINQVNSEKVFEIVDQDILNSIFNDKEILFLDTKWNCQDNLYLKNTSLFSLYLPKDLYKKHKQDIQKPSIIHFSGEIKLWDSSMMDGQYELIYWDIAHRSPFFPLLCTNDRPKNKKIQKDLLDNFSFRWKLKILIKRYIKKIFKIPSKT